MDLRRLRKNVYHLQDSRSPAAHCALRGLLAGYRFVDRVLLKRARHKDLASEKLVSHQRRFLGVVVPKAGSRTLISGLQRAAEEGAFDLDVSERPIDAFTKGYDAYFTFAYVRNPWARCYSCYKQKFAQCTPITYARTFNGRPDLDPSMTFDQFVRWLVTDGGSDAYADRHWLSQWRILGLDRGMRYDFVGKLETFRVDAERLAGELGIRPSVFTHDLKTSSSEEYLRHYTPELVELVGRRYAEDVQRFGFEAPRLP